MSDSKNNLLDSVDAVNASADWDCDTPDRPVDYVEWEYDTPDRPVPIDADATDATDATEVIIAREVAALREEQSDVRNQQLQEAQRHADARQRQVNHHVLPHLYDGSIVGTLVGDLARSMNPTLNQAIETFRINDDLIFMTFTMRYVVYCFMITKNQIWDLCRDKIESHREASIVALFERGAYAFIERASGHGDTGLLRFMSSRARGTLRTTSAHQFVTVENTVAYMQLMGQSFHIWWDTVAKSMYFQLGTDDELLIPKGTLKIGDSVIEYKAHRPADYAVILNVGLTQNFYGARLVSSNKIYSVDKIDYTRAVDTVKSNMALAIIARRVQ